jgi:hypothetical protein
MMAPGATASSVSMVQIRLSRAPTAVHALTQPNTDKKILGYCGQGVATHTHTHTRLLAQACSPGRKSFPMSMQKSTKSSITRSTSSGKPSVSSANSSCRYSRINLVQVYNQVSGLGLGIWFQGWAFHAQREAQPELSRSTKKPLTHQPSGSGTQPGFKCVGCIIEFGIR